MIDNPNATVRLRTGVEVPASAAATTWLFLKDLLARPGGWVPLFEAHHLALNPEHVLYPDVVEQLRPLLGESGRMHDYTRAVVLASFAGEGAALALVDPVAGDGE